MAAVAALDLADTFEAVLTMQIVAANAHAKECLRVAAAIQDPAEARRCCAQDGADYKADVERRAPSSRSPPGGMREGTAGAVTQEDGGASYRFKDVSVRCPKPRPMPPVELTEAERCAVLYPDRGARIRPAGDLPVRADCGPIGPELVGSPSAS
ncbi:MAG TPA: hypothetical protein VFE12_08520 [Acetobacteraceae bacterium]|jgi:hypothetical protein|nr:hypothetical protein [Acetobacteraceae bacterium]